MEDHTVFGQLKQFSFGKTKFPVTNYSVAGGLRDHVHEFPHNPGGAPEKLGRKLYEIQVSALFIAPDAIPEAIRNKLGYKQLFPTDIGVLRAVFEGQETHDLHIPTLGTIKAYAVNWVERTKGINRSGIEVDMTFREDQDGGLIFNILEIKATLAADLEQWDEILKARYKGRRKPSLFDQISEVALKVLSIKDQGDLYGSLVVSKIQGLMGLINEANAQVDDLKRPDNYELYDAMLRLHDGANELRKDILSTTSESQRYTTPVVMSVSDVAVALYGSNDRAVELMQLNALDDPLAIPAGTQIRYYEGVA